MGYRFFASDLGIVGIKIVYPLFFIVPVVFFPNYNDFLCIFLAIGHHYARGDGKDPKKTDDKMLLFDFQFFQQLAHPEFVQQYKETLNFFVQQLISEQEQGTIFKNLCSIIFFPKNSTSLYANTCFLYSETVSAHTQRSHVKTAPLATVSTEDPLISITLDFEVLFLAPPLHHPKFYWKKSKKY